MAEGRPITTPETETREFRVRGFVVQRPDGQWYAHCIDLTVDGLAPTRDEAISKMARAGALYLEWAVERGQPMRRPSPLEFRVRYRLYGLKDRIRGLFNGPRRPRMTFQRPLAAA